ncbi:Cyanovirin-N [Cladorrhinum samala]|uniref:Cyanovirin-N n=1 Tax=Cladorrhinum samala TaxID=585594 RepID=A0AAV9HN71_9PEZI|nr:Cyanovirin-N [Cladorrhinum samala]
MKFTLATITLGLATLPELTLAGGGFASSCKDWYWMDNKFLVATCKKKNGSWLKTRQDMNLCIINRDGFMSPEDNGRAFDTCSYVRLEETYLTAYCDMDVGNEMIDLNQFVENRDGYMWCFNHRSAPY